MRKNLYEAIKNRRSHYQLSKSSPISNEAIQELMEHALLHAPSAFNSQSGRIVLLLNNQHDQLWHITREALRQIVPEDSFSATDEKISSFQEAYGTVLFFDDHSIVENLQNQFPLYKDNFPVWAQQSSGMLQHVVWTALEAEGLGASLQHYNELIETQVKQAWDLPKEWKLIAQMPFGTPSGVPGEKVYQPIADRLLVVK